MLLQAIIATLGRAGAPPPPPPPPPPANGPIGNMYNKTAWTDLTDFETSGGFSLSGGKIQVASGAGYLRLISNTRLDKYKISVRYKYVSGTESSGGLKIGQQSSNTTVQSSAYAIGNLATGMVSLNDSYSNTFWYSAAGVIPNPGDILQLDMDVSRGTFIATWTNITQGGASISRTVVNNYTYGGAQGIGSNTSKVAIFGGSAVYEIQSITYSSTAITGGICTCGDSITDGSYAGSPQGRYSELLGAQMICAGGGDKSAELLSHLPEIIGWCRPSKIYIMIGTNDIFQAVPAGVTQGNINSIVNQLQAQSIITRLVTSPPSNGADMSPLRNFLLSNYASITIDTWPALSNGGTGLNPAYNAGDGTHLNPSGNTAQYNAIVASGK